MIGGPRLPFTMQSSVLRVLEFERVVDAVANFALTPMGEARLRALEPATEGDAVAVLLRGTTETRRYLAANSLFPLRAAADLPEILDALDVEGAPLAALQLVALSVFLESVEEARAAIRRAAGSFPRLEAAVSSAASFKSEIAAVRDAIDPGGEVVDGASSALKAIRDRLRRQ